MYRSISHNQRPFIQFSMNKRGNVHWVGGLGCGKILWTHFGLGRAWYLNGVVLHSAIWGDFPIQIIMHYNFQQTAVTLCIVHEESTKCEVFLNWVLKYFVWRWSFTNRISIVNHQGSKGYPLWYHQHGELNLDWIINTDSTQHGTHWIFDFLWRAPQSSITCRYLKNRRCFSRYIFFMSCASHKYTQHSRY